MARLSDKEFSLKFELRQLQQDRNRLERIKERTDEDLSETRQRIKILKNQIDKLSKPKPKKTGTIYSQRSKRERKLEEEKPPSAEPRVEMEDTDLESEVKVDASSMTADEDSVELKDKKPVTKTTKAKEEKKTDPTE